MAVAGFGQDELDLTVQENVLIVTGRAQEGPETADRQFLHRGIAKRALSSIGCDIQICHRKIALLQDLLRLKVLNRCATSQVAIVRPGPRSEERRVGKECVSTGR